MNTRYVSGCTYAVSTLNKQRHVSILIGPATQCAFQNRRQASVSTRKPPPIARSAIDVPIAKQPTAAVLPREDHVNPPASTLPPPLELPERGNLSAPYYWYRVGRSYGSFYWVGVKAVWKNHKAAKEIKQRVFVDLDAKGIRKVKRWKAVRVPAVQHGLVDRAEFQMLERNAIDIGKLPVFGTLVAVFGEWLPLLVPFIPNAVPGTCRIPKQVKGMREKAQIRRQQSFRQGVLEPARIPMDADSGESWPLVYNKRLRQLLQGLRKDQLMHMSSVLNTHSTLWDRVALPPPSAFLRHRLRQRLHYLVLDDYLLSRADESQRLKLEELTIACEERGLDVLGRDEMALHTVLSEWVHAQHADGGRGVALSRMLFRRPNAW